MSSVSEKIRSLRLHKGWSLEQLADLSNTSKSYIWELENRPTRKPSVEKITLIAEALGVSINDLLEEAPGLEEEVAAKGFFRKFKTLGERDKKIINDIMQSMSQSK